MAKKVAGDKEPAKPVVSESGLDIDPLGRPQQEEQPPKSKGFNASDPKQIEAAKKEDGRNKRQDRDFYQACMATPERRASFYRLLERFHIFGTPFMPGDANTTFFQLGLENAGKQLMLAAMDASTDLYLRMLKEQKDKERKSDE